MAWWIAGGAVLLVLVVGAGLLAWGAIQAAKEEARWELRRWGDRGGRPPHEGD